MSLVIPERDPCPFCENLKGAVETDSDRTKRCAFIERQDLATAFVKPFQNREGATLVVPTRHAPSVLDLTETEAEALARLVRRVARGVHDAFDVVGTVLRWYHLEERLANLRHRNWLGYCADGMVMRSLFTIMLMTFLVACGDEPIQLGDLHRAPDKPTRVTMEELTLNSDIVARVQLLGKTALFARTHPRKKLGSTILEFRFRVVEYLKGTGASEIYGWVIDHPNTSAGWIMGAHNAIHHRYDNREAIVFFDNHSYPFHRVEAPKEENKHILSNFTYVLDGFRDGYTVASVHSKNWFPVALPSEIGDAAIDISDPLFLVDVPPVFHSQEHRNGVKVKTATTTVTMSLSAIKRLIADVEAEANIGGTDEWRDCIRREYSIRNSLAYYEEKWGKRYPRSDLYSERVGKQPVDICHQERINDFRTNNPTKEQVPR